MNFISLVSDFTHTEITILQLLVWCFIYVKDLTPFIDLNLYSVPFGSKDFHLTQT